MKRHLVLVIMSCIVTGVWGTGCVFYPAGPPDYRESGALTGGATDVQVQPLTVSDVKTLAKAGISADLIISQIRNSHAVYRLSAADIIDMKNSGVSEKIIDFMINTATRVQSSTATVAAPQSPRVVESVVVVPEVDYIWTEDVWGWGWHHRDWDWHPDRWDRSFHSPSYEHHDAGHDDHDGRSSQPTSHGHTQRGAKEIY